MKATSSSAKTLVGSDIARVSVPPIRLTGSTSYFLAMFAGTSRSVSPSMCGKHAISSALEPHSRPIP